MLIKIIGLAWAFAWLTVVGIILGAICCLLIRIVLSKKKTLNKEYSGNQKTIAFYLPFIDDLEDLKLLLFAFDSINNTIKHTKTEVAIYTYEERSVDQLLHFGYERYGVKHNIEFEISIKTFKNWWIINHYQNYHKSQFYKAIWSIILIIEALTSYPPDIFIDLSGAEFAYPFAKAICPWIKILSCAQDVFIKSDGFSDRCQSEGTLKYSISTIIYMLAGYFWDQVLTNTEMLKEQFERIWSNSNVELLIPPWNITEFKQIDIAKSKENLIVSLCSFSDEEALKMQIRAFAYAKNSYVLPDNIHLYLICKIMFLKYFRRMRWARRKDF